MSTRVVGEGTRSSSPIVVRLGAALERAIDSAIGDPRTLSVLYSGGLDSSLVAYLANQRRSIQLVAVGLPGSPDLEAAASGARLLGSGLHRRELSAPLVLEGEKHWRSFLEGLGPIDRAVLVATGLAVESADERRVLCGQGADELFFGYAHFRGLDPGAARVRRVRDLDHLIDVTWPRSTTMARALGKELRSPFLDPTFVKEVLALPEEVGGPSEPPKSLLRAVALHLGLPAELVARRKRAFQYGSRVEAVLRSASRTNARAPSSG